MSQQQFRMNEHYDKKIKTLKSDIEIQIPVFQVRQFYFIRLLTSLEHDYLTFYLTKSYDMLYLFWMGDMAKMTSKNRITQVHIKTLQSQKRTIIENNFFH